MAHVLLELPSPMFFLFLDRCGCNATSVEGTSYLCHHSHKVCGSGLEIQSLTRFDSQDPAVSINRKLGKWWGLVQKTHTKKKINFTHHFTRFLSFITPNLKLHLTLHFYHTHFDLYSLHHMNMNNCTVAQAKSTPLLSHQCLAQM